MTRATGRRADLPLVVLAVVGAAMYGVLALSRWNTGLVTNYDLGIFAQSARSYAEGRWPHSDIRQLPLLGDHFSPILAVNGLAWRLWPDPRVLIVAQALALSFAVFIVGVTTRRLLGRRWAMGLMILLFVGVGFLAAVMFDVHETAYAAPIMAMLCRGLVLRRWPVVVASSLVLLLVKEDLGLTVMGVALCWLAQSGWRDRTRAALLVGIGAAGLLVATFVIARVNPDGGSEYLGLFGLGRTRNVTGVPHGALLDSHRLLPWVVYSAAALGVGWRSPLTFVALPTLIWRTASSNPLYWAPEYHYDVMPSLVGALAAADALRRVAPAPRGRVAVVTGMVVFALLSTVLGARDVQRRLPTGVALREASSVADVTRLGGLVPSDATVATSNDVGAYLVATHRHVHQLRLDHPEPVRYVLFSNDPQWAEGYPTRLREQIERDADRPVARGSVRRLGAYTLVDLGMEQRLPGTRAP